MDKSDPEYGVKSTHSTSSLLNEPQLKPFGKELMAVNTALQQAAELSNSIRQMQEICRSSNPDVEQQHKFEQLKETGSEMVAQLQNVQQQSEFFRLEINGEGDSAVEIDLQMPQLSEITRTLYTSYAPDLDVDEHTLQDYADQQYQSSLRRNATIQGVRIFARYPYATGSSPQRAVNSLSCITGTQLCMLGNVLHPDVATKHTRIPLSAGEIAINGFNIAASDGTPEDLVSKINQRTDESGVHGLLGDSKRLVLQRLDGGAIRLAVRSQTAAILSGYRMGKRTRECNSAGIPVWLADAQSLIEFDSVDTGLALTGKAVASLELNALHWDDLHCKNRYAAQFAFVFLDLINNQLSTIRKACQSSLSRAIEQLENIAGQSYVTLKKFLLQLQQTFLSNEVDSSKASLVLATSG